jgi:carboxymethylenebutenolidase
MMKWIKRIVLGVVVLIVFAILALFAPVGIEAVFGPKASDFTNVQYEAEDGTMLDGYLAVPDGEGPFPSMLMVHEWWGLNADIIALADQMADEGYVVLAPDTYRGETTTQVPRALYLRLNVSEDRVDSDMMAAFDYLASLPEVDADRMGVMGFCYGGGVALRHGIQNEQIKVTINLYGDTVLDPTAFGALPDNGTLLGIFGEIDETIPLEEVEAFKQAVADAGIEHTITVYDGVGHAFVEPDTINEAGQAQAAWQQILDYLEQNL